VSHASALYEVLDRCLAAGETTAVATIVQRKGSSPREVGAKMLIRANGDTDGTVGGGCGEAEVWRTALDVMADRESRTVVVDLTEEIAMNTDGVCGGIMEIFVEPWTPAPSDVPTAATNGAAKGSSDEGPDALGDGQGARALTRGLLEAVAAKQPALTATIVSQTGAVPSQLGAKLLVVDGEPRAGDLGWRRLQDRVLADVAAVTAGGRSHVRSYTFEPDLPSPPAPTVGEEVRSGTVSVFFEVALPKPVLVIVGAGHVAVPVAEVGRLLDFDVVVIDDRPSFANPERFPTADRIVVDDFEAALDALPITPATYVVLVTRGHAHDVRSLRRIVDKPAAYIGMIGSRRRVFAVFKLLHEEGVPIETLLRVHAPIGLDVETETPGEIAVSIGAEILKARRGGRAASLSDRVREQHRASLLKGDERWLATR
jgi:xanthine dehydrogenase accessory factor